MPLEFEVTTTLCPFARSTLVKVRNAARRYIVVSFSDAAALWQLWIVGANSAVGFDPADGQTYVTIHRAIYADLIFSDWYVFTNSTGVATVLDAWDA